MFIIVFFTSCLISQNVLAAYISTSSDLSEVIKSGDVPNQDPEPDHIHVVQDRTATQFPKGIVPYYIETASYDSTITERIQAAMDLIEASSCVVFKQMMFKPADLSNGTWVYFTNPDEIRECVHEPGKGVYYGEIIITIGYECMLFRYIVHAVLHAIGFKDEVSHPHRDQYIRIMWENIQPTYRKLFLIQHEDAPYKLVEYDPMSIMHFHDRAFSMNGAPTIIPRVPGLLIAPSEKLSQLDVMKLRLWFGHECNKRKVGILLEKCKTVFHNSPSALAMNQDRQDMSFPSMELDAENSYDREHQDENEGNESFNGGGENGYEGSNVPNNGDVENGYVGSNELDNGNGENGYEGSNELDNGNGENGYEGSNGPDNGDVENGYEGDFEPDNGNEENGYEGSNGPDNGDGENGYEGDFEPGNDSGENGAGYGPDNDGAYESGQGEVDGDGPGAEGNQIDADEDNEINIEIDTHANEKREGPYNNEVDADGGFEGGHLEDDDDYS